SVQVLLQSRCNNYSKDLIDITANTIVNDNIDLCVCYVQKTCIDRAIEELDIKLKDEYEIRKTRPNGRPYFDPKVLQFQNDRLAEPIRLHCGPTPLSKLIVYEEIS